MHTNSSCAPKPHTTRLGHLALALAYSQKRRKKLLTLAKKRRQNRLAVTDRDFPVEIIHFKPAEPKLTPLLLIGGMGPLAGLEGFESALRQFQNSREILLFQVCHVPCRTEVIKEELDFKNSLSFQKNILIREIARAILAGKQAFAAGDIPVETIILCNTAHYFLEEICNNIKSAQFEPHHSLRIHSLIDTVVSQLKPWSQKILVLSTKGAVKSGLYENVLQKNGVPFYRFNDDLLSQFMEIIYRGIKGFDHDFVIRQGSDFFLQIKEKYPELKTLVAGCTEVPLIIDILKKSPQVDDFLTNIEVIDPLQHALEATCFKLENNYENHSRLY